MMLLILFLMTFLLTALCRHYALARNIMDVPNHRSSHTVPTPRGGGVAFVAVFLAYLVYISYQGGADSHHAVIFFGVGLFVAGLGFMDDLYSIPSIWRLLGHFTACGFALFCLGGMPSVMSISPLICTGLALLYLVWCLNLYNFMDGIDGLAAMEGVTVCLGGAGIYWMLGYPSMVMLPLAMAAVVAGFLCWNFPRARIFMGDAGSGFLGLMIGLLSIQAAHVHTHLFWSWLILSGVFFVDATVTLLRRMANGSRLDEAHRSHAYQRAADVFQHHAYVTVGVLIINLVWLLPLALLVGSGHLEGITGLLIAYVPLVILVFQFSNSNHSVSNSPRQADQTG